MKIEKNYDVAIIGGGLAGLIAAIASAREGAKTALIQDRPVLGGNASSEIRMHICGADHHGTRPDARETGILEEILLEHKRRNLRCSWAIFDSILWEKAAFQENLDLYLNTRVTEVVSQEIESEEDLLPCPDGQAEPDSELKPNRYTRRINEIRAHQLTTEKEFVFKAAIFVDATGDGFVGAKAGADFVIGRESKDQLDEADALPEADAYTMGSSLMFKARDMGEPVPFIKPFWANTYTEEDMRHRPITEICSGYWWIELGGGNERVIEEGEEIRDELLKAVYGVWDYIKNSRTASDELRFPEAASYDLEWVGALPGKRESRRLLGDYILREEDCLQLHPDPETGRQIGTRFPDTVAYGGWPVDVHTVEGFRKRNKEPNRTRLMEDVYAIPFRCYYSRNVRNLMMAGRDISASHLAFASSRVMATCAVGGQAVGTAAAMCCRLGLSPRALSQSHIHELQQRLIRQDCYLPSVPYECGSAAHLTASDALPGHEAALILDPWSRTIGGIPHDWQPKETPAWLEVTWDSPQRIRQIQLLFDSDLSRQLTPSLSDYQLEREYLGTPPTLVKGFKLAFYQGDQLIQSVEETDNYQRRWECCFEKPISVDKVRLIIESTHGTEHPKVYALRVWGEEQKA